MLTFRKILSAEGVDRFGQEVVSDVSRTLKKSVKDIKDAGKKVSDKYHLPNDKFSKSSTAEQLDAKINKLERLKNHPNMPKAKKAEIDSLLEELKTIKKDLDVPSEIGTYKTTAEHLPDVETAIKNESEFAQTDFLNKDAYGNDLNDPLNPLNKMNPLSPHYEDPMTRGSYNQDLYDPFNSMNNMDPLSPYYNGGF